MKRISWSAVLVITLLMVLVAFTGSSFTHIDSWYYSLHKPPFQPPNWLFAPVWTLLYILIGIAAYLLYQSKKAGQALVLGVLFLNLILNVLWSYLFFTDHNLLLAMFDLVLLWLTTCVIILKARPLHSIAAWLFAPYLLWLSFAGVLNYTILVLNR